MYFIKSKAKQAKRARAEESTRQTAADPVALVRKVRDLGREVGGIRNLKKLVDLLAE